MRRGYEVGVVGGVGKKEGKQSVQFLALGGVVG